MMEAFVNKGKLLVQSLSGKFMVVMNLWRGRE
jgi:hypothetical protein